LNVEDLILLKGKPNGIKTPNFQKTVNINECHGSLKKHKWHQLLWKVKHFLQRGF